MKGRSILIHMKPNISVETERTLRVSEENSEMAVIKETNKEELMFVSQR